MNETVSYDVNAINNAIDMLNRLTVVGVQNANLLVAITRILQSPIPVDNGAPASEATEAAE